MPGRLPTEPREDPPPFVFIQGRTCLPPSRPRWRPSGKEENNVLNQTVDDAERYGEVVPIELEAGEVSVHSDLLLHDVGYFLEDGPGTGSEWRTPALWGLRLAGNAHRGTPTLVISVEYPSQTSVSIACL